jgi:hypothetical protein
MPTAEMLAEIEVALRASISPSTLSAANASDVFEVYVFSIAIQAARAEGAAVSFHDVLGNAVTSLTFRTAPGYIFSREKAYTHAVLAFPAKPLLEAHVGVRVVGKSGVLHECDVALIEQAEAETCRQRLVPPRSASVLVATECKFYSTPLRLNLAREFLGLTLDLSAEQVLFVTNSASDSVEKLLSQRKRQWEHNLSPGARAEVMRLRHKFQDAFQYFKAR